MTPALRDTTPLPRAPDSATYRRMLNGADPYARRLAAVARHLWLKQRPRQDAEALLGQVLEDMAAARYSLDDLEAYVHSMPLVAAPCWRLAEMIGEWQRPCRREHDHE